jgi:tetratricopeptide (TPR) repeat protein
LYLRERVRDHQAHASFVNHQGRIDETRLAMSTRDTSLPRLEDDIGKLRGVLEGYGIAEDGSETGWANRDDVRRLPPEDRDRLRADIGETFYLMAQVAFLRADGEGDAGARAANLEQADRWNAAAARYAGDRLSRAVHAQRAALVELRGDAAEAGRLRREGAALSSGSSRDLYLLGLRAAHQSHYREAEVFLRQATLRDPKDFSAWFVRGVVHLYLEQPELAVMSFGACLAIRDDFAPAWINRGIALGKLRLFDRALQDFDRAIALEASLPDGYVQRAIAKIASGDLPGAEADLTDALGTDKAPVRVYYLRANLREQRGNADGAKADREAGLALTPTDELSWVGRAEVREAANPKGALADVEEALKLNPRMLDALQMKAHLLDVLNRPAESLAVLNRVVELYPDSAPARAGRGVLLARSGESAKALRDAADALTLDTRAPNQYQVACIYALTLKVNAAGRAEALRLLRASLSTGYGLDIVDSDSDLDPLRDDSEFKRIVARAKELEQLRKRIE